MRVVDSSLWVEYFADGPLADKAEKCIEPLETCIVPAMVTYELVKWSRRNFNPEMAIDVLSILTDCHVAAMDTKVAAEAALLSIEHKLHATDAIIYATAQLSDARLFTCDAHFKNLPGVEFFEKPGKDLP
jgi:predicted nucleic acid-binding protein